MRKRARRNKNKKQRNIIIVSVICLTFTLITAYSAFSTTLTLTAKGNIVDKNRTIQSWTETSNEDFHAPFYKENIVTATFLDTAEVPNNAIKSWDVSVDKRRGVMAYVTESQTETGKYDLYIGAKNGVIANEDSSYLFYYFKSLESIDFRNNFDTSNVTNMTKMFLNSTSLIELDLSSFNTSKVTSMYAMFCMWDDNKLPNKLKKITFGENFKTNNVTNMRSMFACLTELESLDVSRFDTSKVTDMNHMFLWCSSLTTLDVSGFNTSKVTDMNQLFNYCNSLTELNLCSFDTNNVTDMAEMFNATSNLTKIKVGPKWTTSNATTIRMFASSGVSSVTTGQC